jgi:hypothetical protein
MYLARPGYANGRQVDHAAESDLRSYLSLFDGDYREMVEAEDRAEVALAVDAGDGRDRRDPADSLCRELISPSPRPEETFDPPSSGLPSPFGSAGSL